MVFIIDESDNCCDDVLSFFQSLPQIAFLLEQDGKIKQINDKGRESLEKIGLPVQEDGETEYYSDFLKDAGCEVNKVRSIEKKIKSMFDGSREDFEKEILLETDENKLRYRMHISRYEDYIIVQKEEITEIKVESKEHEKIKEKYDSLVNTVEEMVCRFKPDSTLSFVNKAYCENLGCAEEQLINRKFIDFISDKDAEFGLRKIEEAVETGEKIEFEDKLEDDDGNIKHQRWRYKPIFNKFGEIEEIQAVGTDITERKEKEKQMERLLEEYKTIFNNAQSSLFLLNVEEEDEIKFQRINPKDEELTGLSTEEVEGKTPTEVFGEKTGRKVEEDYRKCLKKRDTIEYEEKLNFPGGNYIYYTTLAPVIINGRVEKIVGDAHDITEGRRMEELFQKMLSVIPDMVSIHDTDMNIIYSNWSGIADVPEDKQEPGAKCYRTYRNREDICPDCQAKEVLETGEALQKEVKLPEGGWYDLRVLPIKDEKGEIEYFVEWVKEISEQKEREERMEVQKDRLASIIEGTNVGTWEWNVQTGEVIFNEKWAEMAGYTLEELQPTSIEIWREFVHPEDLKKSQEKLTKHFKGENEQYHLECRMRHREGHWIRILDRGRVVTWTDDGRPEWMYGTHLDITERKKRQEKIEYMSHHDELTDLYNRNYLEEKMKELDAMPELPLSIMMVDVNGLKLINDTYGHEIGDELLIETAEIFRESTREKDFIARWSGDEFVILLPETDINQARKIRNRIEKSCSDIDIDGIPLTLGIGEAAKTKFEEDIFKVLHEAEANMEKDKLTRSRSGKNKLVSNLLNTLSAKSD